MQDLTAKRTLVKSPPELWNELSEVERLARHLDAFGEIKITKLEPEHTVAWEGEGASGTVSIEPSGWGTKVTLTAQVEAEPAAEPDPTVAEAPETEAAGEAPEAEPQAVQAPEPPDPEPAVDLEPAVEPEPPLVPEPPLDAAPRRRGFFARLFGRRTPEPAVSEQDEAAPMAEAAAAPEAAPVEEPVREEPEPEPVADEPPPDPSPADRDIQAILDDVLDALGSAHHRPFSRG